MAPESLSDGLRETLAVFDEAGVPLTTPEAAESLDLGRRSAYDRLERLVERGYLETKKVGAGGRVWWRPVPAPTATRPAGRQDSPAAAEVVLDDVLGGAPVGVFLLDADREVTWANDAVAELLGLDPEVAVGRDHRRLLEEAPASAAEDPTSADGSASAEGSASRDAAGTEGDDAGTESVDLHVPPGEDREERWLEHRSVPVESGACAGGQLELYVDVTPRRRAGRERERELEEYRRWNQALIENFPAGAVGLVDEEFRYVTFAGTPEGETNVTRADLEGAPVRDVLPPEIADVVVPAYEAALAGHPSEFVDTIDDRVYQFHFAPVRDGDGEVFAATAMSQDVTERQEREEALRDAKLQLEAATEAGAVGTWEWQIPEDRFVTGPSFAKTFGVDPEAAREGVSLDEFVGAIHEDDRDRVEGLVEEAVSTCGDYEAEYRVRDAEGELRWVVARGHVRCDEAGEPLTFPGALTDITERKRAERELGRQREQLVALNSLHEVFQDITDAVIERSTRAEIEAAVCEGLAAVDSFSFAWVGEANPATQTLDLRAEAGVEGYLDGVTVSVDPDDERSQGPGGQAFLTREVQVARDAPADLEYEPWREHVDVHGVRSIAGVPVVYDGRTYGVLGVYSSRPDAFADAERRLLGQLGEVVGHAIAAVERKRALMSDEVTELEFRIDDVFGAAGMESSFDGRISLDRAVPATEGEFLVYGTATGDAWSGLHELVAAIPHWTSVSRLGEAWEGHHRFELRMSEPPMLSVVAALGGHVETALIEDGDCRLAIRLPPGGDVGAVSDAVADAYPTAELLAQRQFTRSEEATVGLDRLVHESLTDRQRAAAEAALYSGFFEWPREYTGEEVAGSLGVSPPTFHQHLREAERKVFTSLLSAEV